MSEARYMGKSWFALLLMLTLNAGSVRAAESAPVGQPQAKSAAVIGPALRVGLAAFAKSRGFNVCASELEALDQNLFRDSDYSLRAFLPESNVNTRPFSALIDSRKINPQGNFVRALTNIVVSPGETKAGRCTVMYEQTLYHDQHCDKVRTQMAEFAPETGATSFGSVTFDLLRNMTLTIIPVGSGQCVSIIKEVAY